MDPTTPRHGCKVWTTGPEHKVSLLPSSFPSGRTLTSVAGYQVVSRAVEGDYKSSGWSEKDFVLGLDPGPREDECLCRGL